MDEIDIINTILSKLDFSPIYHKIIKKDNKIFIKCHSYFINIFNNDNDNDNETIIIDLLMDKTNIILPDIHTKPMITPTEKYK